MIDIQSAIQEQRDREAIYKAECAITEKMDLVGKMKVALMKPASDPERSRNYFEEFDPWRDVMNGVFIGSYNSEFDELALTVLRDMRDKGTLMGLWLTRCSRKPCVA